jgi:hypothetical protein
VLITKDEAPPETTNGRWTPLQNQSRWFVANTMLRHEKRIAKRCDRIGIKHFLPLYVVRNTWKNRVIVDVHLPLLPSYILALLPRPDRRVLR